MNYFAEEYQLSLSQVLSEHQLFWISRCLDRWEEFARAAEFKESEITAIERDGKDEGDKRVITMIKWKNLHPMTATLEVLFRTLLGIDRREIVMEVCQLSSLKPGEVELCLVQHNMVCLNTRC